MASGPNVHGSMEKLLENQQLRITLLERRLAQVGSGGGGGGTTPYDAEAGMISPFAGTAVPSGWLLADGTAVSRAGYPALFAKIGTTYGAGDGSTTFNVPNLKGRFVVGQDGTQAEFDNLGETGGAKAHRHTFKIGLFDRSWQPAGSFAGMLSSAGNDASRAGAYRFSDGKYAGANVTAESTSDATPISTVVNGASTSVSTTMGRFGSTGDTDVPGGTTALPPYVVLKWIISTGSGVGGGGSSIPALPDPVTHYPPSDSFSLTGGAGAWVDVPGGGRAVTVTSPMWVRVDMGAQVVSDQANVYGMLGVVATGATGTILPEQDATTGAPLKYANTPFANVSGSTRLQAAKVFLLPAGTTTFTLQGRRSGTVGIQTLSYLHMVITPLAWVGAPGAVAETVTTGMIPCPPTSVQNNQGSFSVVGNKVSFTSILGLSLNGVFSTAYDNYVIDWAINNSTNGGHLMLRSNGVDQTGAIYGNQQVYNSAATVLSTRYDATTGLLWMPVAASSAKFHTKISEPMRTAHTKFMDHGSIAQITGGIVNATCSCTTNANGLACDGFTLSSSGALVSGWVRVYALT